MGGTSVGGSRVGGSLVGAVGSVPWVLSFGGLKLQGFFLLLYSMTRIHIGNYLSFDIRLGFGASGFQLALKAFRLWA